MIDEVKQIVNYYIRKNRNSGRLSGAEFNLLAKVSQIEIVKENVKIKGFETYSFLADEITSIKPTTTIAKVSDRFARPSNLMYLMGLSYDYSYNEGGSVVTKPVSIDLVKENEFNSRYNSSVVNPTNEDPIAKWTENGWQVEPSGISSINCTYIKQPADPVWGYNVTNSREVYASGSSTDFELPESFISTLAYKILEKMGVSVRENQIIQAAKALNNE